MLDDSPGDPGNPDDPGSEPVEVYSCSCTYTWNHATTTWSTSDTCENGWQPVAPVHNGQQHGEQHVQACQAPGGGGGDVEEGEDAPATSAPAVAQLGQQAAVALSQLRQLAESGDEGASQILAKLSELLH